MSQEDEARMRAYRYTLSQASGGEADGGFEDEIARRLRADPLRMTGERWKAVEDDVVGGWALTVEREERTPSEGGVTFAGFMSREVAAYIAMLHNTELDLASRDPEGMTHVNIGDLIELMTTPGMLAAQVDPAVWSRLAEAIGDTSGRNP